MKKSILISAAVFAYCILHTACSFSQGTAINSTGAKADSSAILDVGSSTQGLLIPRMSEAQKNAIPRPAPALLIYQTDGTQPGYYFNAGDKSTKNWMYVGGDDLGNHTATDSLDMSMNKIVNLATCTYNYDAANKLYVDGKLGAGGGGGASIPSQISTQSAIAYTIFDAVQYCDSLTENANTDWHLPSFDELAYFFGSSASTDFLWTKTMAKGKENPVNQHYVSARLSDGKYRNGDDLTVPLFNRINNYSNSTTYVSIGSVSPASPGNWIYISQLRLDGYKGGGTGYMRLKLNYTDGSYSYSQEYLPPSSTWENLIDWNNIESPLILSSIDLEVKHSNGSYYTNGRLVASGYEVDPVQKNGNTLFCRCVR